MKRAAAFFIFLAVSFCTSSSFASDIQHRTGKINLGIAVSLHPKMSLFDFQNLGFYKVPLGLSKKDFAAAVAQSAFSSSTQALNRRIETLDEELSELTQKKQLLFQSIPPSDTGDESIKMQLAELAERSRRIRAERNEAEFSISHPELTTPEETRKILDGIEAEVMNLVREVAREKGYEVVLNTTLPVPFGFPVTYRTGKEFGRGVSGIDQQLFYSLTANHDDLDNQQTKEEALSCWLQLTAHPEVQPFLPVRPWPLVIQGGESMTVDLVRKLYGKYKVPSEIIETLAPVIEEFEAPPSASSLYK